MKDSIIRKALIASVPVLSGYIVLGIGFGVVLNAGGYGPGWALAMSLFIYAGSMEFVGINLLTGGASLLTAALTTLMVNARHLFYGISMVDRYRDAGPRKPYMIFALTDETYSLVCRNPEELGFSGTDRGSAQQNRLQADAGMQKNENIQSADALTTSESMISAPKQAAYAPERSISADYHRYCFFLSLFNQIYWVSGSVIGAFLGDFIPFSTEGIDFALTALFITVFVDQWLSEKRHFPAILGVSATTVCLVLCGSDSFLIPSMAVIAIVLCLKKKDLNRTESHTEAVVKTEGKAELKAKTKTEEKADPETETKTDGEAEAKTEAKTEPKTEDLHVVSEQNQISQNTPEGKDPAKEAARK